MKNELKVGNIVDYKNPSSDTAILSGAMILLAKCIAVACADISPLKKGSIQLEGVFTLAKATGETHSFGDMLHAKTDKTLTKTPSETTVFAGMCVSVDGQGSSDTTTQVKLSGGIPFTIDTIA